MRSAIEVNLREIHCNAGREQSYSNNVARLYRVIF